MWFDTEEVIEFITKPTSLLNQQFYNYLRKGILLDTSPLYLMIIGKYDDENKTNYLKHFQFDLNDYKYFIRFINSINKYQFFITSNVFTEFIKHVEHVVKNKNQFEEIMDYVRSFFEFINEEYVSKQEITKEKFFRNKVCEIGDISLTILGNRMDCGILITQDMQFAGHCEKEHRFLIIPYQSIKSAWLTMPSV